METSVDTEQAPWGITWHPANDPVPQGHLSALCPFPNQGPAAGPTLMHSAPEPSNPVCPNREPSSLCGELPGPARGRPAFRLLYKAARGLQA